MKGLGFGVILAVSLGLGGSAQAANLLTNGSFESGPALGGDGSTRGVAPTGWSGISGTEVPDILGPSYNQTGAGFAQLLHAQDGDRYLDMNGRLPTGALYQDVTGLAAGTALTLSFWSGQWAQNSSGTLTATLIDLGTMATIGTTTLDFAYAPDAQSSAWAQYTLAGITSSGNVRVQFAGDSGSESRGAPGLDNVVLEATTAVPEPASWALMLAGFGATGLALRGSRRRFATAA